MMPDEEVPESTPPWKPALPERARTTGGNLRRVGVELEMIGRTVAEISATVADQVGGTTTAKTQYEHVVHGDADGEWIVELDSRFVRKMERDAPPDNEVLARIDEAAEQALRYGAERLVPVEVVSPPLPMPRLADVQRLVEALRTVGAEGTRASVSYAFGMQFNPEMPDLEPETIASYLKAFLCLYEWLRERAAPDLTRRLTRFAAPFPGEYVRLVVDPDYWPNVERFIDDYLEFNPTRNRALDMLPLFLHVDAERVRAVVDDPKVKPRPALHYRLPNCEIDQPDWGVYDAWNDWLDVETLTARRSALQRLCIRYSERLTRPLERLREGWTEEVDTWLRAERDR